MTASIYDTAWVSMVWKPGTEKDKRDLESTWLFPECFWFIVDSQLEDGSWESYASPVDGILNTAASLLAIRKYLNHDPDNRLLKERAGLAESSLRRMLRDLEPSTCDQVSVELLVVKHISLLQNEGVKIEDEDLPYLSGLKMLNAAKLSKFPLSTIYDAPSTYLHSLEAFSGDIDFSRLTRWREDNGSMMGSPASTAAYLMDVPEWDSKAEQYLRTVIKLGPGRGDWSVPCAWPTTIFETCWSASVLCSAGLSVPEVDGGRIRAFLRQCLEKNKGIVGFAPSSVPDADDTARTIIALRLLGEDADIRPMLAEFESSGWFKTYRGERNASFSANCNVLTCLLTHKDAESYMPKMLETLDFLCDEVYSGHVKEKWHTQKDYWVMLLSQLFSILCECCCRDEVIRTVLFGGDSVFRWKVPIISLQLLNETLHSQKDNGSWGDMCEQTAYNVLALASLRRLPWIQSLQDARLAEAVRRGKAYLIANPDSWAQGRYIWIEKVTYGSPILSRAYCIAAAWVDTTQLPDFSKLSFLPDPNLLGGTRKAGSLVRMTPMLSSIGLEALRVLETQASFGLEGLLAERIDIFPEIPASKAKYMTLIPLIWTACNGLPGSGPCSLDILQQMSVLSALMFEADYYVETVVERKLGHEHFAIIKDIIRQHTTSNGCQNGASNGDVDDFKVLLVKSSPPSLQNRLTWELETFFLAHVTHAADNHDFRRQQQQQHKTSPDENGATRPDGDTNGDDDYNSQEVGSNGNHTEIKLFKGSKRGYHNWIRGTSADHTSCPFAFIFFQCLVGTSLSGSSPTSLPSGGAEKGILEVNARTAYLADDVCRHLANMCRMYNDWGSMSRDSAENNLNSVNFPEFHYNNNNSRDEGMKKKEDLMWIAEYERECLNIAMSRLEQEMKKAVGDVVSDDIMRALRLFVNVTDLFGLIYVQRDMGLRV
ncbi:hypothetical protein GGS20DRAFT_580254 [Poronia punctata]|nr:hypothetical protein GGS20DRAFT_580254 [Poronia punctata]